MSLFVYSYVHLCACDFTVLSSRFSARGGGGVLAV